MGRVKEESEFKSQLVTEICNISSGATARAHCHRCSAVESPFVDWYLLLRVEQNAGIDIIRKKYHKLALQIHPDKNKHPKAEIAFKLVSEAYACLSDDAKRKAFDLERWNSFCNNFNRVPCTICHPPLTSSNPEELEVLFPKERLRSSKKQGLREMRMRFKEEAEVIENCLRANKADRKEYPVFNPSRKESPVFNPARKESPVFNPSDYLFQGYPHQRRCTHKKPEDFWFSKTRNMLN